MQGLGLQQWLSAQQSPVWLAMHVVSFTLCRFANASWNKHNKLAFTRAAFAADLVSNACFLKGLLS